MLRGGERQFGSCVSSFDVVVTWWNDVEASYGVYVLLHNLARFMVIMIVCRRVCLWRLIIVGDKG